MRQNTQEKQGFSSALNRSNRRVTDQWWLADLSKDDTASQPISQNRQTKSLCTDSLVVSESISLLG